MRYSMFLIFTLLCITVSTITAQEYIEFWYSTPGPDDVTSILCGVSVSKSPEQRCINVPSFSHYALSPDGLMIALHGTQDGQIHLLNTVTQNLTSLELCQPTQTFLWDEHYYRSGTFLWSPDARYLAFTGVTALSCDIDNQANVYVYDTVEERLRNLTNDISVTRTLITPASWSPDSEWLILYGVWSESDDGEFNRASAFVSHEGTDFREIAPNRNTCRLISSPDMTWLTSNTDCFESPGTGSDLMFVPFDFEVLSNATGSTRYIDEIMSPIHFGHRPISGWASAYSSPVWINEQVVVAYRMLSPISGGYLSLEEMESYSSSGIVAIDISTMTETMLVELDSANNTTKMENWFISRQNEEYLLINPLIDANFVLSTGVIPCIVRDSVRLSTQGDYIAVLHNCSEDGGASLFVYSTEQLGEPLFEQSFEIPQVTLLDFSS